MIYSSVRIRINGVGIGGGGGGFAAHPEALDSGRHDASAIRRCRGERARNGQVGARHWVWAIHRLTSLE